MYHKVLEICNCFRETLSGCVTGYNKTTLYHYLSGNLHTNIFINVHCDFVNNRGNPYETSNQIQLHNFINYKCIPSKILSVCLFHDIELYRQIFPVVPIESKLFM